MEIFNTFCVKVPKFLPLISSGKNPYLVRLYFGRYLDKIGRFFTKRLVTLAASKANVIFYLGMQPAM
jgi:hypothetical protein